MAKHTSVKQPKIDKAHRREIKQALVGWVHYNQGCLEVNRGVGDITYFVGFNNGSTAVRLLGLCARRYEYSMPMRSKGWDVNMLKILYAFGKPLRLSTLPNGAAVFVRRGWRNPVIMTLERNDEQLLVGLYTARSIFASSTLKKMRAALMEKMPKQLHEVIRKQEPEPDKTGEPSDNAETSGTNTQQAGFPDPDTVQNQPEKREPLPTDTKDLPEVPTATGTNAEQDTPEKPDGVRDQTDKES